MRLRLSTLSLACLGVASLSPAQVFSTFMSDTHTGLHDLTNSPYFFAASYQAHLTKTASDPDLYINSLAITPGSHYDPGINVYTSNLIDHWGSSSGVYTMGTAIHGAVDWKFDVAKQFGVINTSIANGLYDFYLDVIGGSSSTDTTIVGRLQYFVDVTDRLDVTVATWADPDTIQGFQETQVYASVKNNMTDRNFVTNFSIVTGFANTANQSLPLYYQNGDWNNHTVTPGGTYSNPHSRYRALGSPPGTYSGRNIVVGGLYLGDEYMFRPDSPTNIYVVPEPSSAFVIVGGILVFVRRRRRS